MDPNQKNGMSVICGSMGSANPGLHTQTWDAWEQDLGTDLSEEQWDHILDLLNSSSIQCITLILHWSKWLCRGSGSLVLQQAFIASLQHNDQCDINGNLQCHRKDRFYLFCTRVFGWCKREHAIHPFILLKTPSLPLPPPSYLICHLL